MTAEARPTTSAWAVDPSHSSVEFSVKHLMIATVRGRFTRFEINAQIDEAHPERSSVEVRVDASSVDTKDPQRDAHLRSPEFFDVEKYPAITFNSRRIEPLGGERYRVVGDLTIRDVTREVVLETTAALVRDPWGKQRLGFSAEATINRKDWGLTWNVPLEAGGVLVGEQIKLNIEGELVKQS